MQEIKTVCRGCVFAEVEEKTQVGCKVNQIEKLVAAGGKLLDAYDERDNEFYIIDGQFCVWKRPQKWGENNQGKDFVELVRQEMRLQYQLIIIANNSLEDLKKTIVSAVSQKIKPGHITVIRELELDLDPKDIIRLLQKECTVPWNNKCIIGEGGIESAVDDIIGNKPRPYYGIFRAGCEIPYNLFSDLDEKVMGEGFKFALITPNSNGDGYIVPTSIHIHYMGNVGVSLETKIRDNPCQTMIYPISSLFDYFPK